MIGVSKLHFVDAKAALDLWVTYGHLAPVGDDGFAGWEESEQLVDPKAELDGQPVPGSKFGAVPMAATRKQSAEGWKKTLTAHLYQNVTLDLLSCPTLKLSSKPGESEGDFQARVAQAMREKRDVEVAKLKAKYAPKLQTLSDQVRRAEERVEREKAQAGQQKMQTALNVGATILGALMGRRMASASNLGRATTTTAQRQQDWQGSRRCCPRGRVGVGPSGATAGAGATVRTRKLRAAGTIRAHGGGDNQGPGPAAQVGYHDRPGGLVLVAVEDGVRRYGGTRVRPAGKGES